MADENDALAKSNDAARTQATQIQVNMLQGEHSGQPIYANLSHVQSAQSVVLVDFGFLDPKSMLALNQTIRSGTKPTGEFNAKMSCRMVLSVEAANQLTVQLSQLFNQKAATTTKVTAAAVAKGTPVTSTEVSGSASFVSNKTPEVVTEAKPEEKTEAPKSDKGGFRFPWSKK